MSAPTPTTPPPPPPPKATPAPPTAPPAVVVYQTGPVTLTVTSQDGSESVTTVPNVWKAHTSYYNEAEGISYSKAMESWASKMRDPYATLPTSTATASSKQASATQVPLPSSLIGTLPTATGVLPTQTASVRPPAPVEEEAPQGLRKGLIFGSFLGVLAAGAACVALWVWCRRRRPTDNKTRSLRYPYVRRSRRYDDMEKPAARSIMPWSDSSQDLIIVTDGGRVVLRDSSSGETTFRCAESADSASTLPATLPSDSFVRAPAPLSPIMEVTYDSTTVASIRRHSLRSVRTFTSSHSHRRGIGDTGSVGSHESGSVRGTLTNSADSARSSQQPIQSEGPYPLPQSSGHRSSFLAALARSRAAVFQPDPIVNENFLGPKDRGLAGSDCGESFDWRRCSFATDEERAMWIKAYSVEGSVASGHSKHGSPAASFDSQLVRSGAASPAPAATAASTSSGKRQWQSFGLHNFATVDEGIMWLRSSRDDTLRSASQGTTAALDENTIGSTTPGKSSWPASSSRVTLQSSRTSSQSSIDTFTSANANSNARPSLGINTSVTKRSFHESSTWSSFNQGSSSSNDASPVDPFSSGTPASDVELTELTPLQPIYKGALDETRNGR